MAIETVLLRKYCTSLSQTTLPWMQNVERNLFSLKYVLLTEKGTYILHYAHSKTLKSGSSN